MARPAHILLAALALRLAAIPSAALAQQSQPTAADLAVAEALFREGKQLLEQGQFDAACPKLDESRRIDPAGGTLLLLGICYEAAGKIASAWVVYGEALAVAEKDGRADRAKRAKESMANLEKRLSYLTVKVAPEIAALEGFEIQRDSSEIRKATHGVAVPVDPGKHFITAKAKGYKLARIEVEIGQNGDRRDVEISALEKEEEKAPPPPDINSQKQTGNTIVLQKLSTAEGAKSGGARRVTGLLLGGAGVVSLGIGTFFGLQAKSDHDDALSRCPASPCGDQEGVNLNESAKTNALIADITVGAGIALVGTGVVLILLNPSSEKAPEKTPAKSAGIKLYQITPAAGKNGGGIWLSGAF